MRPLGVLGAGSWGTALAVHYAQSGREVVLWARDAELADELGRTRRNERYLPGAVLPASLRMCTDLADLAELDQILIVVPSHAVRDVVRKLLRLRASADNMVLVSAAKGIETETLARMSQVVFEEGVGADKEVGFAVLSGPTFAVELARGDPTAAVIASEDVGLAGALRGELSTDSFRLYSSADVVGVEIGAAAKNVIAIAAGTISGFGYGHNTLAALVTRGLHEITRLGVASGGQARTFSGLAGLGDLLLTCTGDLSRNRRTGILLAEGMTVDEASGEIQMVAEGVRNALSVTRMARRLGVEMPITEEMEQVLYEGKAVREAIAQLMSRELKAEADL